MKVVCAGLAKTGTTSLAKALRTLGFNVYDYKEHFTFHRQEWLDSFETDRFPNFKEMYHGVTPLPISHQHFGLRRLQPSSQKPKLYSLFETPKKRGSKAGKSTSKCGKT